MTKPLQGEDVAILQAVALFNQGFSCSQAIFSAFCGRYGLDQTNASKISCAFGGGMASSGEMCGAVTGALLCIGLAHGRNSVEDIEAKKKTYALTHQFWDEFRSRHGSLICRELLGIDLGTPDGTHRAREAGLFRDLCPRLVEDAAEILERIL